MGPKRAAASAEVLVPGFEGFFEFGHELATANAVDEEVIEAEAEVLHGADGNGIVAFGADEDGGFVAKATGSRNAIRGLPQTLGGMYFKKSSTSEVIGCILTPNWDAKMEIPAGFSLGTTIALDRRPRLAFLRREIQTEDF
jgi:hypothetical protein